jgi:ABC-2 type transport system permease protein
MAGLFEKDIRLFLQRRQALVLFLALAVVLGFTQEGTFILGYLPFLCVTLTISTISYDEMDNGYTFLMTLPIDSKTYVKEKYLFCMSGTLLSWIFASILYIVSNLSRGKTFVPDTEIPLISIFLLIMILFMAIMIPLQLKFGAEKSRIVIFVIFGILAILVFLFVKVVGTGVTSKMTSAIDRVFDSYFMIGMLVLAIVSAIISFLFSCKIMKNKEL